MMPPVFHLGAIAGLLFGVPTIMQPVFQAMENRVMVREASDIEAGISQGLFDGLVLQAKHHNHVGETRNEMRKA